MGEPVKATVLVVLPDDYNDGLDDDADLCEVRGKEIFEGRPILECARLMGHEGNHFDEDALLWWRAEP